MDYVLAPFLWLIGILVSIVFWIVTQILWILLWLILPLLVIAFVALRIAERVLGQEKVRGWVRARTQKYGSQASKRAQRWIFALGVVPVRVLFWFVLYAIWHSIVSLVWRPHWSPWQRAWGRRWRKEEQLQPKT
ncbi:MAG: hypothetical protein J0H36_07260 [Hyphomicrobium denitrificans]|nr:hypothetical protein [Hyphomicrobium denitrificans]